MRVQSIYVCVCVYGWYDVLLFNYSAHRFRYILACVYVYVSDVSTEWTQRICMTPHIRLYQFLSFSPFRMYYFFLRTHFTTCMMRYCHSQLYRSSQTQQIFTYNRFLFLYVCGCVRYLCEISFQFIFFSFNKKIQFLLVKKPNQNSAKFMENNFNRDSVQTNTVDFDTAINLIYF